ncbi:MAG TPA: MtrB/PioB family decaheme-associated outer membrane protein [Ramlibacter sp.]
MKANTQRFALRLTVLAAQAALAAMSTAVQAQSIPTAEELTTPSSTVEVGATYTSPKNKDNREATLVPNTNGDSTSYKFGEYNGLYRRGTTAIGNFDLRGGAPYDSNDPTRWRLTGRDLGLDTRSVNGEYGQQGTFRFKFGYDELFRARSDTYMTPYTGEGTSNLALPANWIKPIVPQASGTATTNTSTGQNFRGLDPTVGTANGLANGVVVPATAATLASQATTRAADLADYRNVNLSTRRKTTDLGFSYELNPRWEVVASVRHETKDGLKPLSVVSSQVSEYAATLPDPIHQTTDQYNATVNFRGEQSFFTGEYYISQFSNDIKSVTWNDSSDPTKTATYAAPPSNQFHQLTLSGGYTFTPTTRLVGSASYGRNTQNDPYVTAGQNAQFPMGLPVASLDGKVITKAVNLKLTTKPMKDLGINVAYKYDDRDNQTPVNTYAFQDANEAKSGTNSFIAGQGSNLNLYANRPYSKKLQQLNLDGDYRISKSQAVGAGVEEQRIDRGCSGSWINCADAPKSTEDTFKANWRAKLSDSVDARLGAAYSRRRVDYDENAFLSLVPYANVIPTLGAGVGATSSVYQYLVANGLTGFGPVTPYVLETGQAAIFTPNGNIIPQALYASRNNINELVGMRRFNMADRDRAKLRGSVNWQANEQLGVQASVDYLDDNFSKSVFGLTSSRGGAFNLEGNYQASESLAMSLFFTYEDRTWKAAGDAYGSNNNGTGSNSFAGNAANTNVSPVACYGTITDKNVNAKVDPCLMWNNSTHDRVDTIGFTLTKQGLFSPKFTLSGSVVYSRARTDINVSGGSYVANPLAAAGAQPGGVGNYYLFASALPTISTETIELMLDGRYQISKMAAVHVRYLYGHMKAVDWGYDGMQFGTGTNYLPTNEQAPNFHAQAIGVSYIYKF